MDQRTPNDRGQPARRLPDADPDQGRRPAPVDPVGEDDRPARAPGRRQPYPVNDPGIADPDRPGSEPDYDPGRPIESPPSI